MDFVTDIFLTEVKNGIELTWKEVFKRCCQPKCWQKLVKVNFPIFVVEYMHGFVTFITTHPMLSSAMS